MAHPIPEVSLHPDDLSVETLESILRDLEKYRHLSLYRETYFLISVALKRKKKQEDQVETGPSEEG